MYTVEFVDNPTSGRKRDVNLLQVSNLLLFLNPDFNGWVVRVDTSDGNSVQVGPGGVGTSYTTFADGLVGFGEWVDRVENAA